MDEELVEITTRYAERHNLCIRERLGFGVQVVFVAERKAKPERSAVKFHERFEPYDREKKIYERLAEAEITKIEGFNVPQLLGFDDEFLAIEMSIVKPPFLLDFAGGWLGRPPDLSQEQMTQWEEEKQEQFGRRWDAVKRVFRPWKHLKCTCWIYRRVTSRSAGRHKDEWGQRNRASLPGHDR